MVQNLWDKIEVFISKVIIWCGKTIGKEVSHENLQSFLQFVRFGIVGVSNTLLGYVLNVVFLLLFQRIGMSPDIDYLVAQFIAFVVSVAWSFYWNNRFVFVKGDGENRVWWKALIKTYISYSFTGIFLNSLLSWIWVTIFHISKLIAPLINLIISVPLNFLINKFWAFKREK